jgi:hypothetical protein
LEQKVTPAPGTQAVSLLVKPALLPYCRQHQVSYLEWERFSKNAQSIRLVRSDW